MGSGANTPGRAGRPIEHPGRNLQPSRGCPTREAAPENLSASLLNHLMNIDQASGPRMSRIKKLVLRDTVGVPSSCCTMRYVRIYRGTRMRRHRAPFSALDTFFAVRSWVDCTTSTFGFDLRQAQGIEANRPRPLTHVSQTGQTSFQSTVICPPKMVTPRAGAFL